WLTSIANRQGLRRHDRTIVTSNVIAEPEFSFSASMPTAFIHEVAMHLARSFITVAITAVLSAANAAAPIGATVDRPPGTPGATTDAIAGRPAGGSGFTPGAGAG